MLQAADSACFFLFLYSAHMEGLLSWKRGSNPLRVVQREEARSHIFWPSSRLDQIGPLSLDIISALNFIGILSFCTLFQV